MNKTEGLLRKIFVAETGLTALEEADFLAFRERLAGRQANFSMGAARFCLEDASGLPRHERFTRPGRPFAAARISGVSVLFLAAAGLLVLVHLGTRTGNDKY